MKRTIFILVLLVSVSVFAGDVEVGVWVGNEISKCIGINAKET